MLSCSVVSDSWTVALHAPLSMEFSQQEYWSGLPFPSLGDLPDPGIEARSPALQVDSFPFEPPGKLHSMYSLFITTVTENSGLTDLRQITAVSTCGHRSTEVITLRRTGPPTMTLTIGIKQAETNSFFLTYWDSQDLKRPTEHASNLLVCTSLTVISNVYKCVYQIIKLNMDNAPVFNYHFIIKATKYSHGPKVTAWS